MVKRSLAVILGCTLVGVPPVAPLAQTGDRAGDRQVRMLQRLDLNRDGVISQAEARAAAAIRFLRWDGDGDGAVTEAEMRAAAEWRVRERAQKRSGQAVDSGRIERRLAKRFARMDANGDGRVERAEFERLRARRFARLDQDGDGGVSRDEFRLRPRGQGWGRDHDRRPEN